MLKGKAMRQRQGANTQGVSLTVAWQGLAWKKGPRHGFRLQKRMDRAAPREDVRTVHKLQQWLVKSWYARLLAVRRMTQDHRGKHPAGRDGAKPLTPPQRWRLANTRHLDGTATALRRIWIPKRGSRTEKRPLGIPTQADRARQTVVRQALAPAWEANLSPHPYGLRPGRSGHDAIGAIFPAIRFRPQYALKLDIAKCFDRIDQQALLAKVQAPPRSRRQLQAWRNAGSRDEGHLAPTTAGPPQGGSGAPLLALIALPGMEKAITRVSPHARVIAYADDGVGLHEERQGLEHGPELRKTWLAEMGLSLHETKSGIRHTCEGDQPGFEFLGCDIRPYRVSTYQAGQGPGGHGRLGCKTLLKPAKGKVQDPLAALGRSIKRGKALPPRQLIRQRTPIMRGWANYYRVGVSHAVYERLDHLPWLKRRPWARWRHPRPSTAWAIRRYWHRVGTRRTCATSATDPDAGHRLAHSEVPMTRHVKVPGHRSPYDGDWVDGSTRQGRPPNVGARRARLLKQQHGRCRRCGLFCQHDDRIAVDHGNGNHRDSRAVNLQALHGHCHEAKTREQGDDLPPGLRDKHQHTEERREAKVTRAVLEQR